MFKKTLLVVFCLSLAGCASQKAAPKEYEIADDNLFVPVNLDVSAGEYVASQTAEIANYLASSLKKSGQFSRIEKSFLRWPHTVEIQYSWEQPMNAADFTGTMISASTLLIVPGYMDEIHTINVTILEGDKIASFSEYTTEIRTALSLWHNPVEQRKEAINTLLNLMFEDFRKNSLLPTLKEVGVPKRKVEVSL